MQLDLYYFEQCPYCQVVLKKIDQLKLTNISLKNILTDKLNADFHFKTTGRRTVPCLYINGVPMFESQEIIQWLEENKSNIK